MIMKPRADQVAGAVFILLGLAVFALGGDLPFGRLSAPGAGMMPKLVATVMMLLAGVILLTGRASRALDAIDWSDWRHAALVVLIAGAAIAAYQRLGFLITMALLVFLLLAIVEGRNIARAAAYSVGLTLFAYWLFGIALKAPLERGLFWL
jgi:hypothetical protein